MKRFLRYAVRQLKQHGIQFRFLGGKLLLLDCFTSEGYPGFEWVDCPRSKRMLLQWLGY